MLFESWLLLHAADLAEQAATHLVVAVQAVQHEAQHVLEEITSAGYGTGDGGVNGGCAENLPD